jgi:hypothetical protein
MTNANQLHLHELPVGTFIQSSTSRYSKQVGLIRRNDDVICIDWYPDDSPSFNITHLKDDKLRKVDECCKYKILSIEEGMEVLLANDSPLQMDVPITMLSILSGIYNGNGIE